MLYVRKESNEKITAALLGLLIYEYSSQADVSFKIFQTTTEIKEVNIFSRRAGSDYFWSKNIPLLHYGPKSVWAWL